MKRQKIRDMEREGDKRIFKGEDIYIYIYIRGNGF